MQWPSGSCLQERVCITQPPIQLRTCLLNDLVYFRIMMFRTTGKNRGSCFPTEPHASLPFMFKTLPNQMHKGSYIMLR